MSSDSFNPSRPPPDHPLLRLPEEDLNLIVQLVLASGSLKALAEVYGVSYPTIRGRLDRVIARLRDAVEGREPDPLGELLADLVERGEMTVPAARAIREAARDQARRQAEDAARRARGEPAAGVTP